jgi:hypothetical protein
MASFSLDPSQIFGLAELVRSWLPWQWRPFVSPWLILSGLFLVIAIFFVALHFVLREKPKISWEFEKEGTPISLEATWNEGNHVFLVGGLGFGGENISGHALHQVDGEITLLRDRRTLPVFVAIEGRWMAVDQIESAPSRSVLSLGGQFRGDGLHWSEFPSRMTPDEFLRDFGAFSVSITIDGDKRTWSFTIDELREQIERQKRQLEDQWLANPLNRPQVGRKRASATP